MNHFSSLTCKLLSKIEDDYNKLLKFHKFEEGIITDKAPHNFKWLGVIKLFFKVFDVCISILPAYKPT